MSNKKTYNEIKESLRNELSKNYKHRIEHLQNYANSLRATIKTAEKERDEARERACTAEDENYMLKLWIERLCDYCNMTEDDRRLAFEAFREEERKAKSRERIAHYIYDNPLFKFLNAMQQ